jgi:GNAT superfamily N-acetyltransferase
MKVRRFEASTDYEDVCKWWKGQGWEPLPLPMLPKAGFIVEKNGTKLCAGWLYETDSKIAWAEWIVGNPEIKKGLRREGLDELLKTIIEYAKGREFGLIFASIQHRGLIERYEKFGFTVTERSMTNLIGRLE